MIANPIQADRQVLVQEPGKPIFLRSEKTHEMIAVLERPLMAPGSRWKVYLYLKNRSESSVDFSIDQISAMTSNGQVLDISLSNVLTPPAQETKKRRKFTNKAINSFAIGVATSAGNAAAGGGVRVGISTSPTEEGGLFDEPPSGPIPASGQGRFPLPFQYRRGLGEDPNISLPRQPLTLQTIEPKKIGGGYVTIEMPPFHLGGERVRINVDTPHDSHTFVFQLQTVKLPK